MSRRLLLLLSMFCLPQAGCACVDDWHYMAVNHYRAHNSWRNQRRAHKSHPHLKDFGDGWEQGYFDVATGSNGLPPVVPPREYWSAKYQNPDGSRCIQAWFDGYRQGATTAQRSGVQNWNPIAVSDDVSPVPVEPGLMTPPPALVDAPALPQLPAGPIEVTPTTLPPPQPEVLEPVAPSPLRPTRPSEVLPELKTEGGAQ